MRDTLYELIQSLTKSEKRYFKLMHGGEHEGERSRYLLLFDTLVEMQTYDPEQIQSVMEWDNFKSSYSMAKRYLNDKILKSLRDFERKDTETKRVKEQVRQVETLFRRGLLEQAGKKVRKAKRSAYRIEALISLLKLLKLEQQILMADQNKIAKQQTMLRTGKEIEEVVKGIRLSEAVNQIHYQFYALVKLKGGLGQGASLESLDEIIRKLEALNPLDNVLVTPQIYYYNILNQYCYLKGGIRGSIERLWDLKTLFESNEGIRKENLRKYLSTLHNLCNRSLYLKEYTTSLSVLEVLFQLPRQKPEIESRWKESYYSLGSLLLMHSGAVRESIAFVEQVEAILVENPCNLSRGYVLEFNRCLMIIYTMLGEGKKAISHIQILFQDPSHKSLRSFHRLLPVVELLIHYDLGNFDWLEQRTESLLKHYDPEKAYRFEKSLLLFLRELPVLPSRGKTRVHCEAFLSEMTELRTSPEETPVFAFFDFEAWVKAKAVGISMGDVLLAEWAAADEPEVRLKPY